MGLINPKELLIWWCLLCHRKLSAQLINHFCHSMWAAYISNLLPFFWKAGWEQPLPHPGLWISHTGGMMIKRLPRVTTHYRVLFPKTWLPVLTDLFCWVKDILGWNLALFGWENTKNNFLFEMYWPFSLCVPCIQELGADFSQDHILPSSTDRAVVMPIKLTNDCFRGVAPLSEAAAMS